MGAACGVQEGALKSSTSVVDSVFFIVVLTMPFKAILPAGEGFLHTWVLLVVSKKAP